MELIADILMIAGTMAVALYCVVLSKRLSKFTDLEKGVGGAIAVLSAQVDDLTKTLTAAQKSAAGSAARLQDLTERAEATAKRMELLIASMHDLPDVSDKPAPTPPSNIAPKADGAAAVEEEPQTLFLSQRTRVEAAE